MRMHDASARKRPVTVGFWKPHSSWTGACLNAELQRFPSCLWRDSDPDYPDLMSSDRGGLLTSRSIY